MGIKMITINKKTIMKKLLLIAFMLLIMVTHHTLAQSNADASWVLTADQNAVVTGDIVAHHQTLHNLSVNNYISGDRKSTRLNSSHVKISYAVFCLKKKRT